MNDVNNSTRKIIVLACAALVAMNCAPGSMAYAADPGPVGDKTLNLKIQADSVTFLQDPRQVLLLSNRDRRIGFFDIDEASIVRMLKYDERLENVMFSDVAVDPESPFVFLVGVERQAKTQGGVLVRLDIESLDMQVMRFADRFVSPSVAASSRGRVFIGDLNSSTVTVVEEYYFDKLGGEIISRSFLERNIYLKQGPAFDIGASPDGRFILVSHTDRSQISLVDAEVNEVVDVLEPGGDRTYPLVMDVPYAIPTSVVFTDHEEDTLVVADVDGKFQSFSNMTVASLGLGAAEQAGEAGSKSPLLVSAGSGLQTIVVANRADKIAAVFSHNGRTLERRNLVDLKTAPDDIDVSPDGGLVTLLNTRDATLRVIRNPLEWSSETGVLSGSDRIRQAQRMLSMLQFPIGSVDGIDGPNTQRAVSIFQQGVGLEPSGVVDRRTLEQIENVASELPLETAATREPKEGSSKTVVVAPSGRQCVPVPEKRWCRSSSLAQFRAFPNRVTEEMICAAPEGSSAPVQIDTYDRSKKLASYHCTSFHSCAFIRFRELRAYDTICRDLNRAQAK